eukprot:6209267-Pleurochrysis_carterae.AAC.1
MQVLECELFHHFASVLRRPAGRADKSRGSQQCAFEMTVPSEMAGRRLFAGLQHLPNMEYSIDSSGNVARLNSPSTYMYYIFDQKLLSKWVKLHKRGVVRLRHLSYASSNGVAVSRDHGHAASVGDFDPPAPGGALPPQPQEACGGDIGQFNYLTDLGFVDFPPAFEYAAGERESETVCSFARSLDASTESLPCVQQSSAVAAREPHSSALNTRRGGARRRLFVDGVEGGALSEELVRASYDSVHASSPWHATHSSDQSTDLHLIGACIIRSLKLMRVAESVCCGHLRRGDCRSG